MPTERVDLRFNLRMETEIATEIGRLTGLGKFLGDPKKLCSPSHLTTIRAVEFKLSGVLGSGSLPTEIGLLTNLKKLLLSGQFGLNGHFAIRQGFLGSIPSEIGLLSKLGKCRRSFHTPLMRRTYPKHP
jgi:hypothetical protein